MLGYVKDYERKLRSATRRIEYCEQGLIECEAQLDAVNKELEDYKIEHKKIINGVGHRLFNSKSRQEILHQIAKYDGNIRRIKSRIDLNQRMMEEYQEQRLLLENYHNYGENEFVKSYVHTLDEMLKERKNVTYGRYAHVYSDLRERAAWLNEINHPEGPKYEAIACWCAYKDYQCDKADQESAHERFLQLGFSCSIAEGYCMSYFVYHEPEIHNPDPMGIRDGVYVDGRGV